MSDVNTKVNDDDYQPMAQTKEEQAA
jgi:hypothetical protein